MEPSTPYQELPTPSVDADALFSLMEQLTHGHRTSQGVQQGSGLTEHILDHMSPAEASSGDNIPEEFQQPVPASKELPQLATKGNGVSHLYQCM